MAEYIEREALIDEFKRLALGENSLVERIFADGVYAVIETFPTADVVPVVRCKDCKYYKTDSYYCQKTKQGYCEFDNTVKQKQGYCSYGERRCAGMTKEQAIKRLEQTKDFF